MPELPDDLAEMARASAYLTAAKETQRSRTAPTAGVPVGDATEGSGG